MKFDSIDNLPIYNYNKILESGNFELYGVKTIEDWENIEREFFNDIGYSEKYFEILRIKTSIVLKKAKYYQTGNVGLKAMIEVEKAKLKQTIGEVTGNDFDFMTAQLSKYMGFKVDVKTTTVREYYSYLKLAQNG